MKKKNKKFECVCGRTFLACEGDYRKNKQNVYEAFCPVCGRLVEEEKSFNGSGGGKF